MDIKPNHITTLIGNIFRQTILYNLGDFYYTFKTSKKPLEYLQAVFSNQFDY